MINYYTIMTIMTHMKSRLGLECSSHIYKHIYILQIIPLNLEVWSVTCKYQMQNRPFFVRLEPLYSLGWYWRYTPELPNNRISKYKGEIDFNRQTWNTCNCNFGAIIFPFLHLLTIYWNVFADWPKYVYHFLNVFQNFCSSLYVIVHVYYVPI